MDDVVIQALKTTVTERREKRTWLRTRILASRECEYENAILSRWAAASSEYTSAVLIAPDDFEFAVSANGHLQFTSERSYSSILNLNCVTN